MNDQQAVLVMADTFLRLVAMKSIDALIWFPLLLVIAYAHAKWSR